MRHAGPEAIARLAALLDRIETVRGLTMRRRGVYYAGGRACLHFHEDPSGLYADFRPPGAAAFARLKADSPADQDRIVARIEAAFRSDARDGGDR